jgi:tRNA-specific 2-thiouridylase
MAKVLAAMSGGVDSSVTAALMKEAGHEVVGATMSVFSGDASITGNVHGCYGPEEEHDIADAQRVAGQLGIPFHVIDLKEKYRQEVLDYTCDEYCSGRTPNPCVRCNRTVKFDALLSEARNAGIQFDYVAMGHYVRVEYDKASGRYLLKKAKDKNKDQTYFLHLLSQAQLGICLFPLGDYTKDEVRKKASDFGLDVADKAESQNFISGGYSILFDEQPEEGQILDKQGNVLGKHKGIPFYTIGQRRGLGIAAVAPLYVTGIDAQENVVYVGSKDDLLSDELTAADLNWIAVDSLTEPTQVKAKIRYRHTAADALVTPESGGRAHVKFSKPQMSITPGQAVVFYAGDSVLGGGTIEC